ncbi:MAG: TIM-barrel domain-containing protein [Candidatus Acidiferrales bacterium]
MKKSVVSEKQMVPRRDLLKFGAVASALGIVPLSSSVLHRFPIRVANGEVELQIAQVTAYTVRLTLIAPPRTGDAAQGAGIPSDGSLVRESWPGKTTRLSGLSAPSPDVITAGNLRIQVTLDPLTVVITAADGAPVQTLHFDKDTGIVSFALGSGPILGMGQGGAQFDRRGNTDNMHPGQGGYKLHTHGARVPVPWLIGTSGWAMFFHAPFGTFDLTGSDGKFQPANPEAALPLDLFVTGSRDPQTIMGEFAELTGHAELPPLWSLGYQQSHRTLASREEVLQEARTFREKQLPCDALIYLGTGFCPSGWNTENGSFVWNRHVFPDPQRMIDELHAGHFKVVLHAVILADRLHGTVKDSCELARFDEESASCYWDMHRAAFADGVDGWWPDEGDPMDIPSWLTRIRMYWDGAQMDRPNERPYALHRNGYAGMQRYAAFLWSGDVYSLWETLRNHVPIAVNTGLTGIPYWGTDIGGFVPTKELTGELYVRWFQFGAFCTLFRAHGRTWKLRLPWGWNTGDMAPEEIRGYNEVADPDPSELHNAQVEPICKKYLELRYRLMPYLYSAVRECCLTGIPVMRALWLHYPGDSIAVTRGDEFTWGRDILVAPVTEKGATTRKVYLPAGNWYDFWTEEPVAGGKEITRDVDLATMPLYVREGCILPLGPVKQYTGEHVDAPLNLCIFPGADAEFTLYEDDGISFSYRQGEWTGLVMSWNDHTRRLTMRLADGSKLRGPVPRKFGVRVWPAKEYREIQFDGHSLEAHLEA